MKTIAKHFGTVLCFAVAYFVSNVNCNAQNFSQFKKSFQLVENTKGTQCNSSSSILLKFKNTTAETMDFQYAIQDANGVWQTGLINTIAPNEDTGEIVKCESNGRFKWWARPSARAAEFSFPAKSALNK